MFRKEIKSDIWLRTADLVAHGALALILPGHWFYQFLPDIFSPILFLHGLVTDHLFPEESPYIVFHRFLHTAYVPLAVLFLIPYFWTVEHIVYWQSLYFVIQWLGHITVDQFTHRRKWDRKFLWRIDISA